MRFYSAKSIGGDETSKIRKEKRDIIGSDKLISDDKKSNGDDKKLLRELCAKIRDALLIINIHNVVMNIINTYIHTETNC